MWGSPAEGCSHVPRLKGSVAQEPPSSQQNSTNQTEHQRPTTSRFFLIVGTRFLPLPLPDLSNGQTAPPGALSDRATAHLEGLHAHRTGGQLLVHRVQLLHEGAVPGLPGLRRWRGPHGHDLSTDVPDGRGGHLLSLIERGKRVKT